MPLQKIYNNNQLLMLLCCGGVCVWIIMVRMTNRKWQAAAKPAWNFLEAPAPLQQVWVISSCFVGGGLVWCKGFCFAFSYFFRKKNWLDLTFLFILLRRWGWSWWWWIKSFQPCQHHWHSVLRNRFRGNYFYKIPCSLVLRWMSACCYDATATGSCVMIMITGWLMAAAVVVVVI